MGKTYELLKMIHNGDEDYFNHTFFDDDKDKDNA